MCIVKHQQTAKDRPSAYCFLQLLSQLSYNGSLASRHGPRRHGPRRPRHAHVQHERTDSISHLSSPDAAFTDDGEQMLFTWSTKNLCIVFSSWRITSTFTLLLSLLAIVALGAGYEGVRNITRIYEERSAARLENMPRKSILAP